MVSAEQRRRYLEGSRIVTAIARQRVRLKAHLELVYRRVLNRTQTSEAFLRLQAAPLKVGGFTLAVAVLCNGLGVWLWKKELDWWGVGFRLLCLSIGLLGMSNDSDWDAIKRGSWILNRWKQRMSHRRAPPLLSMGRLLRHMNILVLVPYLYNTAPGQRFRIEQWAQALEPSGVRFHFIPFESPELKRVMHVTQHIPKARELVRCIGRRIRELSGVLKRQKWDAIFLHRELLPIGPPMLERWLAQIGIPIIYDFDDAIFFPDVSDANRKFAWLKWSGKVGTICRFSAHVVVGNSYLESYARRHTDRVTVIPTSIDTELYVPKTTAELHEVPTIGWSGSLTTIKHLRGVEAALKQLQRVCPFHLRVLGDAAFSIDGLSVESRAWSASSELQELVDFDIGIMPLPDEPWARGKCGLKALQYMALGIPTVASPVGVNREIIADGENGFLASSQSEWVEKLSRLLRDAALRRQFSREGRRVVEERYAAKTQALRLLEVLERVSGTRIASAHASCPTAPEPVEAVEMAEPPKATGGP